MASNGIAQTTARDYCNRGVARQKKGDLDGALADYDRAIEINPHDAAVYNNRGLVKIAKGDLNGALADYDRALQISPRNFEIRDNRGVVRQKKGDLDGALADYDIAIKLYRKYALAYRNRANLKLATNDLDGALADCNRAIDYNYKDATAYDIRALIETAKGDLDAAKTDSNLAVKLDPKHAHNIPPALNQPKVNSAGAADENRPLEADAKNLGAEKNREPAAQNQDDLNRTRLEGENAPPMEIEPKNIAAVYDRDIAKRKNEDHNEAIADHTPANEHKSVDVPSDLNPGKKMGVASADSSPMVELPSTSIQPSNSPELRKPTMGDLAGGVAETKSTGGPSAWMPPDNVDVGKQKNEIGSPPVDQHQAPEATVANISNEPDVAKENKPELNVALADRSRDGEPRNLNPGEQTDSATQKDNLGSRSADDDRANESEPTTPDSYDNRAQFEKTIGDLTGALADDNRAIQLDPRYAAAYNGRGNIKRAQRDLDGALADYNRAIELDGGNANAYYNRGITKQTKGDLDGALADFNPAIELDPKNAAAYHSRGAAKAMKGDLTGALADYNRAIELDPKDAAIYNNRAGLLFSAHNWDAALEDYNRFFELSKEGQDYPRLYVWLIRARTGQTEMGNKELVDYLQQRGNDSDWLSTVASHLLGKISDADLLSAAKSENKNKESGQLCEAWFYIGMKKLIGGNKNGAQDCFHKSLATDRKDYTEYHFARAELKAL